MQQNKGIKNEYTEQFNKILREHGGRLTEERRLLLQTICNMKGHFEAENIHETLLKQGHKVSLATIYRNLELIVKAGIIRRAPVAFGDQSKMQFECVCGKQHHDHLICLGCGKKIEFSYPAIEVLQDAVAKEHGFVLTGHNLELHGFCPSCQGKNLEDTASCLTDLRKGDIAKIVKLSGGKVLINKLHSFGLRYGQVIRIVRFAPFRGPILIEDVKNQSKIMLDRTMAEYVSVEEINSGG